MPSSLAEDDPGETVAQLARLDQFVNRQAEDHVTLYLDAFRDHRRANIFSVNPLGIRADGRRDGWQLYPDDFTFDTLWYSEGLLTADGYVDARAFRAP